MPAAGREKRFAGAVEKALREEGGAPWPVFVFSGPNKRKVSLDAVSLASTMRIIVRDWKGALTPASAIVLNSDYWDVTDASPEWQDDRFSAMVAKHEVYHARLAWFRAGEITAHADEIEARLRSEGSPCRDRFALESLVGQAITASEEVSAIDVSLSSAAMPSYRRQGILEYREKNVGIERRAARTISALFPSSRSGKAIEKWLDGFLNARLRSGREQPGVASPVLFPTSN